ncbi:hypothetical protein COS83_05080 [archaeon CG07_land_8_20_14_0_80_38_8]|nr:MAG: hypothetical protein COS83_05080 [archaeon CG07_land_8_20_14_0_80_38_8]PIU88313.1 MAG: hypothetical protein COS64_04020 [archaeon CG06_land_8_20_14_3_00_37_11]
MKFKCAQCGNCCRDFGRVSEKYPLLSSTGVIFLNKPRIVLYDWERNLFPDNKVVPCEVFYDDAKKTSIIMSYTLADNCPHLNNNKCSIYDKRPMACRGFPCPYSDVDFIRDFNKVVDNSRICKAEMPREELYNYLGETEGGKIVFTNQKLIRKSYERYGENFIYLFMKATNDRLVGKFLAELQIRHGYSFIISDKNIDYIVNKIDNGKKIMFSDLFKQYTGADLRNNFSDNSFKLVEKIINGQNA